MAVSRKRGGIMKVCQFGLRFFAVLLPDTSQVVWYGEVPIMHRMADGRWLIVKRAKGESANQYGVSPFMQRYIKGVNKALVTEITQKEMTARVGAL